MTVIKITPDAIGVRAVLRVDAIQRDTLVQMARTWASSTAAEDDIVTALTALADVVADEDAHESMERAHVDALDGAIGLGHGMVSLGLEEALCLRAELDAAIQQMTRFNPSVRRDAA